MVSREDIIDLFGVQFRRFLHDNFYSTEQLDAATTGTGQLTTYLFEIALETGAAEASTTRVFYNYPGFNPHYGTMIFKLRFVNIDDMFAFVGFKSTTAAPTTDMTETHSGFMFEDGNLYSSTADGDNQQKILIPGFTPSNNILYKIVKDKFYLYPLPIQYPYFDGFRYEFPARVWSNPTSNCDYPPENTDHYFVAYIENKIALNKTMYIHNIVYGEEYAD